MHEKTLEMCDLLDDPDAPRHGKHRELDKAEIQRSESAVQKVLSAIQGFTNPFTIPDKDHPHSLASGAPVPDEIAQNVLEAESKGKSAKKRFVDERFTSGKSEEMFFQPIQKLKLRTVENSNKVVKLTATQGKVSTFEMVDKQ